ncbi:unnamed protein product [Orchesella dallaii]|uniref:Ferric-chelate reductase 1 n=1 Tax=Orchesella dallaii TaxID=48710 RepID=A0ABP1PJ11_9HEXA
MWTNPPWISSILISILFFAPSYLPPIFSYRNETFEQELANLQWDGVSRHQILSWWDAHQRDLANIRNSTRLFPICVVPNSTGHYPPRMENWGRILDHLTLQDKRVFELKKDMVWYTGNLTGLNKFRHFDIINEQPGSGESSFKMPHWIYYQLGFRFKVRGVLIQLMSGPLGLPGGELVATLPCTTTQLPNPYPTPAFLKGHFIQPCTYAPRSSSVWPTIFVYDGEPTTAISFQIKWNEAQCQEFGFYQFIVITTRSFRVDDYKAILTPIHVIRMRGTGSYTAPSGAFSKLKCDAEITTQGHWGVRVVVDKAYNDCLFYGKGREKGVHGWTCPPGPFECDTTWKSTYEWDVFKNKSINVLKAFDKGPPDQDCCELDFDNIPEIITTTTEPPTTTTTPTTSSTSSSTTRAPPKSLLLALSAVKEKELTEKSKDAEIQSKVTHGGLCVFTWLVVIPLADHIARYYKDLPDILSLGLGFWTIAHVTLHCFALTLIWMSFGLVVGTGENSLGDVTTQHFFMGFICTALQHMGFASALRLFKNTRESNAFKYLALHSLGGKLAFIFAFFSIILSSATAAMKWLGFALLCIYLSIIGLTMHLEHKQNDVLGLNFHRAKCPVLQRIVMEDGGRPPLMKQKIVLLVVMVGTLFGLFLVMEIIFRDSKNKEQK